MLFFNTMTTCNELCLLVYCVYMAADVNLYTLYTAQMYLIVTLLLDWNFNFTVYTEMRQQIVSMLFKKLSSDLRVFHTHIEKHA